MKHVCSFEFFQNVLLCGNCLEMVKIKYGHTQKLKTKYFI